MPRVARHTPGGYCYHVLNRGNGRQTFFRKPEDYEAFLRAIRDACDAVPMRILAVCLMPNHFHLVLRPVKDGDLGRWMLRVMNAHVRRYHQHYKRSGHLWQGRYKAFPIQEDDHLLTVMRYVERNALRVGLCRSARDWAWSSAAWRKSKEPKLVLAESPVPLPADWLKRVDAELSLDSLESVRQSVLRSRPFGSTAWTHRAAKQFGLTASLNPRGRPRKAED